MTQWVGLTVEQQTQRAVHTCQRALLEGVFNSQRTQVGITDTEGRVVDANDAAMEFVGMEPEQLAGEYAWETPWFESEQAEKRCREAVEGALEGETTNFEIEYQAEDGSTVFFSTDVRPVIEDGTVIRTIIEGHEITELRKREKRLDRLSSVTNELLYTHTEAGVASTVTAIAQHIIDRPLAAMWAYEESDETLYPIGATETATEFAGVDIPKDLPGIGPETVEPFDESERHLLDILSTTATAALDRVSRETEIESQRAALAASNGALQRRREQMEFFNSILRHDILNGMNVIRARADMLASELEGDRRDYAETIVKWSDDIVDLTRKVRSVLQTLADEEAAETKPVELAPVVGSAARRAASMAPGATVDVGVPDDVAVTADDLLHDVVGNVLTNAVEHGSTSPVSQARQDAVEHGSTGNRNAGRSDDAVEHGSTSPVSQARQDAVEHGSTGNRRDAEGADTDDEPGVSATVTATVGEKTVTVRIADDSPGIGGSVRGRIFERGGKSTDSSGTGFGLYFVDAMVESYGGRIRVEESDTGGAAFVVELPRV